MASRGCASNKIAGALIAVVVVAAAVTLMRAYGAGAHGAQGKTAAQASLNDCAAAPVAVKLIEDGEARTVYETDDAELVASTFAALDGCIVGDEVDERMSDAGCTLVFAYRTARSDRWSSKARILCSTRRHIASTVPRNCGDSLPPSRTANEMRDVRDE